MLANQSDFMAYASALKSNYRKGVHRLETILSNPTMSAEFAANLGGVSVVLGVPISMPDRNSDKLLELLLGSAVADNAVETWLHQFYEFTDWDDLLSDSARCQEMANNPLIWRAAGGSKLAVGKSIATLAGLSCAAYKDIDAVVASSTAMAAIVAAPVAMAALWRSDTAIKALQANATAWKTFTGATSAVMGKTVAILANLDPSGYADMTAIAASSTAMAAIQKSQTALNAIAASSMATAKYAAGAAGLNPADYADMAAVAASSTAMTAIIANATALNAVVTSSTAMTAVTASSTAMAAIVAAPVAMAALWRSDTAIKALQANATAWKTFTGATSAVMGKTVAILANLDPSGYADMTAIAASSTAMTAIAASATARAAICASTVAYNYLLSKATYATISGTYSKAEWSTRYAKPCIVLQWCYSHNGGTVGIRTCLDGAASRTYQGSQRYNSSMGGGNFNSNTKVSGTYYKEFVFCSKLETYNSQSDWPAISIAYFPLP